MTNPYKLPLYNKLYIFLKMLYKAVGNMPKGYKYSLGRDALEKAWNCLDLLLTANSLPNEKKYASILALSQEFDQLKMRIRMMHEIDIITLGQFAHWQENYLSMIGDQIGGWLKWAEKK